MGESQSTNAFFIKPFTPPPPFQPSPGHAVKYITHYTQPCQTYNFLTMSHLSMTITTSLSQYMTPNPSPGHESHLPLTMAPPSPDHESHPSTDHGYPISWLWFLSTSWPWPSLFSWTWLTFWLWRLPNSWQSQPPISYPWLPSISWPRLLSTSWPWPLLFSWPWLTFWLWRSPNSWQWVPTTELLTMEEDWSSRQQYCNSYTPRTEFCIEMTLLPRQYFSSYRTGLYTF